MRAWEKKVAGKKRNPVSEIHAKNGRSIRSYQTSDRGRDACRKRKKRTGKKEKKVLDRRGERERREVYLRSSHTVELQGKRVVRSDEKMGGRCEERSRGKRGKKTQYAAKIEEADSLYTKGGGDTPCRSRPTNRGQAAREKGNLRRDWRKGY